MCIKDNFLGKNDTNYQSHRTFGTERFKYQNEVFLILTASTVLPAYLVTRLSRHFFNSPFSFEYAILKPDISSPGYLVIFTSVRALTR